MRAEKIDAVMLYDLDFTYPLSEAQLQPLKKVSNSASPGKMRELLGESFRWLFYDCTDSEWLPGMERIDVSHLLEPSEDVKGASLLVYPKYGVAVASVWRTIGPIDDLTDKVNNITLDDAGLIRALVSKGLEIHDAKREYPFISVTFDQDDLGTFARENAVELGKLLPGGIEHQEEKYLRRTILKMNLSRREYERLYITWTDALALYCHRGIDQKTLDRTIFRALQLCETCILTSRLLSTIQSQIDKTYLSVRAWWPRALRVNALTESLGAISRDLIISPPVQSMESARLLERAYSAFELDSEANRATTHASLLEARFQWCKAQFLAGVAIVVFVLEKLSIFQLLAMWLHLSSRVGK
jgi:hypothetical protein